MGRKRGDRGSIRKAPGRAWVLNAAGGGGSDDGDGAFTAANEEEVRDIIGLTLVAGTDIDITVSDAGDTITIDSTAAGAYTDEEVRDVVGATLVAGTDIDITIDDAGNTITIDSTASAGAGVSLEEVRDDLATVLTAGAGITITPDDGANTITIASTITQVVPGKSFAWPSLIGVSDAASANASKGVVIIPAIAFKVHSLTAKITTVAGATYRGTIYEGTTIAAVTADSDDFASPGNVTGTNITIPFPTPPTLVAGTTYVFVIRRTDGGDTYGLPLFGTTSASHWFSLPHRRATIQLGRLAKAVPIVTDAFTVVNGQFDIGIEWN